MIHRAWAIWKSRAWPCLSHSRWLIRPSSQATIKCHLLLSMTVTLGTNGWSFSWEMLSAQALSPKQPDTVVKCWWLHPLYWLSTWRGSDNSWSETSSGMPPCLNFWPCFDVAHLKARDFDLLLNFERPISLQNFMIQGGDPTGTGRGGESIYGWAINMAFFARWFEEWLFC